MFTFLGFSVAYLFGAFATLKVWSMIYKPVLCIKQHYCGIYDKYWLQEEVRPDWLAANPKELRWRMSGWAESDNNFPTPNKDQYPWTVEEATWRCIFLWWAIIPAVIVKHVVHGAIFAARKTVLGMQTIVVAGVASSIIPKPKELPEATSTDPYMLEAAREVEDFVERKAS